MDILFDNVDSERRAMDIENMMQKKALGVDDDETISQSGDGHVVELENNRS